jgi:hypothetical protein
MLREVDSGLVPLGEHEKESIRISGECAVRVKLIYFAHQA